MRKAMAISLATATVELGAAGAGAAIHGALGALWAVAGGQCAVVLACWITFAVHFRRGAPEATVAPTPATAIAAPTAAPAPEALPQLSANIAPPA
jgi:hypothetical protein